MRKPSKPPRDPGQEIEAILRDAARKILSLLRDEQEATLDRIDQKLAQSAARPSAPVRDRTPGAPQREHRVSTLEVADALRRLFASEDRGLRLSELRATTGFGNMQLHRALQRLLAEGEIRRRGEDRKTEYLRAPTEPARRRRVRARRQGKKTDR